ncbi:hypothetical protein ACFL4Q_04955, partial [candidate division KSB1 bacterium]
SYNMGFFAFETQQADFTSVISDDGFVSSGRFRANATRFKRVLNDKGEYETETDDDADAIQGSGIGLSIGASAKTDKDYVISFVLKNLYNRINWNKSAFQFDHILDTGDSKFFLGDGQFEDLEEDDFHTDNDHEISDFQTSRPFGFRLAVGREYRRYTYASEIGYEDEEFVFALGGGYHYMFLNLYAGYGYKFGNNINFGLGLGGDHFMFDFGFGTRNGITPGSTKGVLFATSLRFGI